MTIVGSVLSNLWKHAWKLFALRIIYTAISEKIFCENQSGHLGNQEVFAD